MRGWLRRSRSVRAGLAGALALGLAPVMTLEAQIQWNAGTGNFGVGANWVGGEVPNASKFSVSNGGTALVTAFYGTDAASISNSSTVELLSGVSVELSIGADLEVGVTGRGTVILGNQTKLFTSSFYVGLARSYFGVNPGSEGVLQSTGGNYTTHTIFNGYGGTGNMTFTSGSAIYTEVSFFGYQAGSFGAMALADSSWTISGGGVFGYGDLTIGQAGGGQLVASESQLRVSNLTLGADAGASGMVTWTGGNLTGTGNIFVGLDGTGSFAANDGAIVNAKELFVGRNAGGSGNATVSGGRVNLSEDLHVGALGTGTLTIENGGEVASDIANVGFGSSAVGAINVLGGNWTNTRAIFVGVSGNGSIQIGAGGTITSESGYIGHDPSGVGTVTLNGGNWTMSNTFALGVNGTATMTANGGTISSEWAQLGLNSGSHGTASLSNATWSVGQTLTIGQSGNGSLTLANGAHLSALEIELADSSGVSGSLSVTDSTVTTVNILRGDGNANLLFSNSRLQLPTSPQVVDTLLVSGFAPGAVVIENGGLTVDTRGGNAVIGDVLSGNGSLTKSGAGRLRLSATNSFTGGVVVEGGALEITASGVLGTGATTMRTGELRANGNVTLSDANAGSPPSISIAANQTATFSATTGQTFTVATGNFSIGNGAGFTSGSSGNGGTVTFAPANLAITGSPTQVTVAAGRLQAANNALEQLTSTAGSTTVAAGATLDFQDNLTAGGGINALYGAGTVRTGNLTGTSLVVNSGDFSGDISGWGGLVKETAGTLILSGQNGFTGGATVNAGTLVVTGSLAFGLGNAYVNTGGTLGGNGTIGNVSLLGGTLAAERSTGNVTISEVLWTDGDIRFDLGPNSSTSDFLNIGALRGFGTTYAFTFVNQGMVAGTTYDLMQFISQDIDVEDFTFTNTGGFDGTFAYNGNTLQFQLVAVPEPSTAAFVIGGALALALLRRGRRV